MPDQRLRAIRIFGATASTTPQPSSMARTSSRPPEKDCTRLSAQQSHEQGDCRRLEAINRQTEKVERPIDLPNPEMVSTCRKYAEVRLENRPGEGQHAERGIIDQAFDP